VTMLLENATITDLWRLYQDSHDVQVRNELVMRYSGLVKSIVRRVASVSSNYSDNEDLLNFGMIGLINAIEKYDASKGAAFETFAVYRIRGEAIDYLRRNDWVPRGVRKRAWDIENTANRLMIELGHQPTDEELADKLGIGISSLNKSLNDSEKCNIISFEELIQDTVVIENEFADTRTPEGALQEKELRDMLAKSIDDMAERERLVITLYYYEELTLKEISNVMGVSESRVSQMHTKSIEKMKKSLRSYING
jgi:RNA polymerase sigma factor for flagellar operon FliA